MQSYKFKQSIISSLLLLTIPGFAFAQAQYHIDKNYNVVPNDKAGNKKVILITIDDGPSKYGRGMADVLARHHAGAIFFINGNHDKANPGNIAYEHNLGFSIGNHTWDHANLKLQVKKEKIKKEIDDDTKLITSITGVPPRFFRPPFGASSQYVRDLAKSDDMIMMNWSGAAKDWEKSARDEKVFMKNVMVDLHPGEILLIHEHEWTAKYLDSLLTTLEQKGYTFADPNTITS